MNKRLSKHIGSFDYFDKWLIALSVTTGSTEEMASACFSYGFSISTDIVKELLKTTTKK